MWREPKINWSSDNKATFDDANRIEENSKYLEFLLQTDTNIPVKTWDMLSFFPFSYELQRMEDNIETLRFTSGFPLAFGYLKPRIWEPITPITYLDLRRMENNILALRTMHELIPPNFKYCGTFSCGEVNLI